MKRAITGLTIALTAAAAACGGGGSKSAPPTASPPGTAAQASSTTGASATTKPATAAPAADFCSRVSPADVAEILGASAVAVTGDSATAVAARLQSTDPAGFLAGCDYRSEAGLMSAASITLAHYEARRAADLAQNSPAETQEISGLGTQATVFTLTSPQPFDVDGNPYTGQVLLFAKNATSAITVSILTVGSPSSVDIESLKKLARVLLQ